MAASQPAIVAQGGAFALYALFKVTGSVLDVIKQCQNIHRLVDDVNSNQPDAFLYATVSFSPSFCQKIGLDIPNDFIEFQRLEQGSLYAPATKCDVLIHLHSERYDLNFFLLRKFLSPIGSQLEMIEETYGYRFLDSRDMTGFIDGTENPQTKEDRQNVAIIADGKFAGGSAVLYQRYIHKLEAWEPMAVEQQEAIIGRTKLDSIELEDVPETSHVGRVDIKENEVGLKILRHSLPYGSVSGDHGLLFIAYCHDQSFFHHLLSNMYGKRDGKTDELLRFTQPVSGAFLYAPSLSALAAIDYIS